MKNFTSIQYSFSCKINAAFFRLNCANIWFFTTNNLYIVQIWSSKGLKFAPFFRCYVAGKKSAVFSNPVKNRVLESCSNISLGVEDTLYKLLFCSFFSPLTQNFPHSCFWRKILFLSFVHLSLFCAQRSVFPFYACLISYFRPFLNEIQMQASKLDTVLLFVRISATWRQTFNFWS